MKYALHTLDFSRLKLGNQEHVSEVILPLANQYDAIETIAECRKLGLRIVWDMDNSFVMRPIDEVAKECKELLQVYGNMAFRLRFPSIIFARKCPNVIFSAEYAAGSFHDAVSLYNAGVRECYVTGALAADIDALRSLKESMKIRVIPNLVQTNAIYLGNPTAINPLNCFWIRPEAVDLYEDVVSVFEFATAKVHNEEGLLAIYVDKLFAGRIGDVVIDETTILNAIDNFYDGSIDVAKSTCGLRCQRDNTCHTCQHIIAQAALRVKE